MDWTTVATAAVTGLVGFGGAWLQGRTSIRQAHEETDRLRLQHREEHLRNRQGTYHEFLRTVRNLDAILVGEMPRDDETLGKCLESYRYCRAGIDLFGTPAVRRATNEFAALMPTSDLEAMPRAYGQKRWKIRDARDKIVEAMRADVAAPYAEPEPRGNARRVIERVKPLDPWRGPPSA